MHHGPLIVIAWQADTSPSFGQLESLRRIAPEMQAEAASLLLINDAPQDGLLPGTLEKWRADFTRLGIMTSVVTHEASLGLVASFNRGLEAAREQRSDVMLVRPDVQVFPGFLAAMREVMAQDNMIGFLCPTTTEYASVLKWLPAFHFIPGSQGGYLWIRNTVLRDFGSLDPAYHGIGFAENDLISRAATCGYRTAQVNAARASRPAQLDASSTHDQADHKLLRGRYPEFDQLLKRHEASPEKAALALVEQLPDKSGAGYSVLFDFSDFLSHHNGTFEAGKKILACVCKRWPASISIHVRIHQAAFAFHQLDQLERLRHVAVEDEVQQFTAVLRFGQIFDAPALHRVFSSGPIVVNFMLDAIAHDCAGLTLAFDPKLWAYVCEWSDAVLTNSAYTANQIRRRFPIGPACQLSSILHSTDPREYMDAGDQPETKKHVLVIGNKFRHKFVDETIELLAQSDLADDFVCIGSRRRKSTQRFTFVESGVLDDDQMRSLYQQARLIIYPSHYEGFGFPLMNAAAFGIPIVARDLPVYREVLDTMTPRPEVRFFSAIDEIPELVRPASTTQRATPIRYQTWDDSATEILRIIEERLQAFSHDHLTRRLMWLPALDADTAQRKKHSPAGGHPAAFVQKIITILKQANDQRLRKRRQARSNKTLKQKSARKSTPP